MNLKKVKVGSYAFTGSPEFQILRSAGGWLVKGKKFSSFIGAYGSHYGGCMTLRDMASLPQRLSFIDFVNENPKATLRAIQFRWMYAYLTLTKGDVQPTKLTEHDQKYLQECLEALYDFRRQIKRKSKGIRAQIRATLQEAIDQFERIKSITSK